MEGRRNGGRAHEMQKINHVRTDKSMPRPGISPTQNAFAEAVTCWKGAAYAADDG